MLYESSYLINKIILGRSNLHFMNFTEWGKKIRNESRIQVPGQEHPRYRRVGVYRVSGGEASGTSKQKPFRRFIENIILGDARRRGENHQWMYDQINLKAILLNLGYQYVHIQEYNSSLIPDWNEYGLDVDEDGNQYKPESLYLEAVKWQLRLTAVAADHASNLIAKVAHILEWFERRRIEEDQ